VCLKRDVRERFAEGDPEQEEHFDRLVSTLIRLIRQEAHDGATPGD
jgi:hypothetical protein